VELFRSLAAGVTRLSIRYLAYTEYTQMNSLSLYRILFPLATTGSLLWLRQRGPSLLWSGISALDSVLVEETSCVILLLRITISIDCFHAIGIEKRMPNAMPNWR